MVVRRIGKVFSLTWTRLVGSRTLIRSALSFAFVCMLLALWTTWLLWDLWSMDVQFLGTAAYDRKAAGFNVAVNEAKRLVVDSKDGEGDELVFVGHHGMIVGDAYVFSRPDKTGLSFNGYYVNGFTGEVTERLDNEPRVATRTQIGCRRWLDRAFELFWE